MTLNDYINIFVEVFKKNQIMLTHVGQTPMLFLLTLMNIFF